MYKVNYQGLNPEITESLRDCCINDIDDSLVFVDNIDSIAIDDSNIIAIEEKEAIEHDLMCRAQEFHMGIKEYIEEFDSVYCFDKISEY